MEEEKLINPAKPKFCSFLDNSFASTGPDSLSVYNSSVDYNKNSESNYVRELTLKKTVCHSCGKEIIQDLWLNKPEVDNDKSRFICSECKKDLDIYSRSSNYHDAFLSERRKSIIAGLIASSIAYAVFLVISFLLINKYSTQETMVMISPIIFYSIFSLVYCLVGDVSPVFTVFTGGFGWIGKVFAGGFGWVGRAFVKPFSSGSGFLIVIFFLFFPYVLTFFTIVIAAILAFIAIVSVAMFALTLLLSFCVCPFSVISRYAQY